MSRKRKTKHFKDFSQIQNSNETLDWKQQRDDEIEKKIIDIKPLNKNQEKFLNSIYTSVITIATGSVGTGRSYLSCAAALKLLYDGKIDRIILCRPTVQSEGELGFLPGTVEDKIIPYLYPLLDACEDLIGDKELQRLIKEDKIRLCALELMKGSSFKNSIIVLDEAEDASFIQLRMVLTRLGHNSRIVINGDIKQTDRKISKSGLPDIIKKLKPLHHTISFIEFTKEDIVRSGIVKEIAELLY